MSNAELVPTTPNTNVAALPFYATADMNDTRGKMLVYNALNDAISLSSIGETPFTLVDIVFKDGTRAVSGDECKDVYLITADGKAYFSQSTGIFRSVLFLIGFFSNETGNVDFGNGIDLRVSTRTQADGRTIKSLVFVG